VTASTLRRWHWPLAACCYALLAVILTWPAARQFSTHVAGFPDRDSLQYTWSLWWARQAWLAGLSPAEATLLYRPWQSQNPLLAVAPMLDWLAFPLHAVLTPTQVYNALLLLSLVFSALAMYALALDRTASVAGALLAGALYAMGAPRLGHALLGHLTHLAAWWFPLAALWGLRALERARWRDAALCGLGAALGILTAPVQAAYLVAPGLALLLGMEAWRQRQMLTRRHLWLAIVIVVVAAAVVTPCYGPFLAQTVGAGLDLNAPGVEAYSVDPALLWLPSPYHPLWGRATRGLAFVAQAMPESNDLEKIAYLGPLPTVLAIVGWWRARRERWPWLALLLISLVLATGPRLTVAGLSTPIPLPYALLQRLPLYGWGRTPERFLQLAGFALALLAAQGLACWQPRWPATSALLVGCIVGMVTIWPWPQGTPLPPAQLAAWRGQEGVALDLPISKRQVGNLAMYYQTAHGLPIIGGYIHRDPPGQRDYVKALDQAILAQREGAERALSPDELRALLQGLDVRRVLLHADYMRPEELADARARLGAALGSPGQAWGAVVVFDVPASPAKPEPQAWFDADLRLLALSAEQQGDALTVTLLWQAGPTTPHDWTVFLHLVDAQGVLIAQHDGQPAGGNLSTSRWAPGQTVLDEHELVGVGSLGKDWHLTVGLYDAQTGARAGARSDELGVAHDAILVPLGALFAP
jgi:hypothetical protein